MRIYTCCVHFAIDFFKHTAESKRSCNSGFRTLLLPPCSLGYDDQQSVEIVMLLYCVWCFIPHLNSVIIK